MITPVEPQPEGRMRRKNPNLTICEELRQTWELLNKATVYINNLTLKEFIEEAMYKLRVATTMAKKMDGRLREYAAKEGKKPDPGIFEVVDENNHNPL